MDKLFTKPTDRSEFLQSNAEGIKLSPPSITSFILSVIVGEGGFGRVVSGMYTPTREWLAIKEINKYNLMKHKSGLQMIFSELKILSRIDHGFIIRLHFAFTDRDNCYLALDLKMGGDLRYYIREKIAFSERDVAFFVSCISMALDYLHSKFIIHRDIKPENIILDERGYPHLADFGVAYIQDDTSKPLICNLASGTKQYLAPEVYTKSHIHGPESDFWSLGVVAYELLFGKRPFEKHVPHDYIQYLEKALDTYNCVQKLASVVKPKPVVDNSEFKDINSDDQLHSLYESTPSPSSPGRSMIYSATPSSSPIGSPFGSPMRSPYSTKELAKRVTGIFDKDIPDKFPCILEETASNKESFDPSSTSIHMCIDHEDRDIYKELPPPYMGLHIVTHWAVDIDPENLPSNIRLKPTRGKNVSIECGEALERLFDVRPSGRSGRLQEPLHKHRWFEENGYSDPNILLRKQIIPSFVPGKLYSSELMKRGSGYFKEPDTQRLSLEYNDNFKDFEFVSPAYNVSSSAKNIVSDSTTATSTETKTVTGTNSSSNIEAAIYAEKLAHANSNSPSRIKFQNQTPTIETRKFFSLEKQFSLSSSLSRSFSGASQSKKEPEPRGLLHSRSIDPKRLQRFPRLF